jgi:hypothetical protein
MIDPRSPTGTRGLIRFGVQSSVHLILEANLDLLLGGRNDVILRRALEVREFGNSLLDDVKGLLDFLLSDDQWGSKTDDVLVSGFSLQGVSNLQVRSK